MSLHGARHATIIENSVTDLMLINKSVGILARTVYLINIMQRIISLRKARHFNIMRNTSYPAGTGGRKESDLRRVRNERIKIGRIVRNSLGIILNLRQARHNI